MLNDEQMSIRKLYLVAFIAFIAAFGVQHAASAQQCNAVIGGSNSVQALPGTCKSYSIVFSNSSYNNKLVCNAGAGQDIYRVAFGANSYNNSIVNCTFGGAVITSMHDAENNLISPYGNYTLNFTDGSSNIAVGYYLTFVPRDASRAIVPQYFASTSPYSLANLSIGRFNNQEITWNQVESIAAEHNYSLPRFGVNLPTNSSGAISFPVETEEISASGKKSFNPYWFICPDWGYDILSYAKLNITRNTNFTPLFIKPDYMANIQLPDKTNIYWNFTTANYSNSSDVLAIIFRGYQFGPNISIAKAVQNFTFRNLSYDAGMQKPGIYQFIGELRSTYGNSFVQSNSTTLNYAVGLAFCTQDQLPIEVPGYYSMAYSTLTKLDVFYPSNSICQNALTITGSNITIDCKGGEINSTNTSIIVQSADNVTLENCKIYGNSVYGSSASIDIVNSSLIADNASNVAFSGSFSQIRLYSTSVSGYEKYSTMQNSSIVSMSGTGHGEANTAVTAAAHSSTTIQPAPPSGNNAGTQNQDKLRAAAFIAYAIAVVLFTVWLFINKKSKHKHKIHKNASH